jgi:hypothetical protein
MQSEEGLDPTCSAWPGPSTIRFFQKCMKPAVAQQAVNRPPPSVSVTYASTLPWSDGMPTVPCLLRGARELRHGLDSRILDEYTNIVLHILYASLLEPHVSAASFLSCTTAAENCGKADRISTLLEVLICVVSRLPAKDGACTAVLSSHWARLWRSTPLVLD